MVGLDSTVSTTGDLLSSYVTVLKSGTGNVISKVVSKSRETETPKPALPYGERQATIPVAKAVNSRPIKSSTKIEMGIIILVNPAKRVKHNPKKTVPIIPVIAKHRLIFPMVFFSVVSIFFSFLVIKVSICVFSTYSVLTETAEKVTYQGKFF